MCDPESIVLEYFQSICQKYEVPSDLTAKWKNIIQDKFNEPHRKYHNFSHLAQLFTLYNKFESSINNKSSFILAIIFHDIIYNPTSSSNEVDSVQLFKTFVIELNDSRLESVQNQVSEMINCTKSHQISDNCFDSRLESDLKYFLAFDMSILSADRSLYTCYCQSIRYEYSHIPKEEYCSKRSQFLKKV